MASPRNSDRGFVARGRLSILETRVARRMLALFLLCALLPSVVLAVIAYHHVSSQLDQQARERLREASKSLGMTMIGRLQLCESELVAAMHEVDLPDPVRAEVFEKMITRLDGLVLVRNGAPREIWGRLEAPIQPLQHKQLAHLAQGHAALVVIRNGNAPVVLIARALDPSKPEQAVLWGQVRLSTLSSDLQDEGSRNRLDVLVGGDSLEVLGASEQPGVVPPSLRVTRGSGDLQWELNGETYLAGYWTAFLGYEWRSASWTVVLSEPLEGVLEPMYAFSRSFLLVVCIALVLVFLLSNIQIRRQMRPLVELQEGTLRVARGEFTHRVDLKTGDEFEALAGSFNSMADRLGEQFSALTVANERLESLSWGTLAALARTIDASSPWTAGHSERVTRISLAIGEELGLSRADLDRLHRGGLLHDIGKIGIPHELLDKPSRLSDEEMAVVRSHPVVGARILAPLSVFSDIIPIVRHHHERVDGTGYPDRLVGDRIPYLARIVAVADVYDALVSDRPYRTGWAPEAALAWLQSEAGTHHEPALVNAFIALVGRGGLRELAELPSMVGEAGAVAALAGGGVG